MLVQVESREAITKDSQLQNREVDFQRITSKDQTNYCRHGIQEYDVTQTNELTVKSVDLLPVLTW